MRTIDDVLKRLRAEFLGVPGLRLTPEQVRPLCGVERMVGQMVLDRLVDEQFLCVTLDGHYAHVLSGHHPHSHRPKADLRRGRRSDTAS